MAPETTGFDPVTHRFGESRYFEDMKVGEAFYLPSRTLTDANFAAFQTVSGDNHPIHYDVEYCRRQGHPGLLAHGFQVLAQTAAGAGIFPHVVTTGRSRSSPLDSKRRRSSSRGRSVPSGRYIAS